MSSQKGIICGLTGEVADFEGECPDFDLDAQHQQELEQQKNKKSFEYEPVVSYIVPKPLIAKWNRVILMLPLVFLGLHLLSSLIAERNYASGLFFWIILVLFLNYMITAGLYRKYPIPTVTISTVLSFIVSLFFFIGVIRYTGPHLLIPLIMSFSYFFVLTELHMYKQRS